MLLQKRFDIQVYEQSLKRLLKYILGKQYTQISIYFFAPKQTHLLNSHFPLT